MSLLDTLRLLWPLILTFVLPRAINFYRALKTAYRTRPQARPLPSQTSNALNILFASICIFLYLSIPSRTPGSDNIFVTTESRLLIPNEALFARLASHRPRGTLTASDEALKDKLLTPAVRQIYLRFGPSTLLSCTFCHPDDPLSYLLYHLPTNVILPHLLHFLALGLVTSSSISGYSTSRWRFHSTLGALALLILDVYLVSMYTPNIDPNMPSPHGLYWILAIARPLSLCLYDTLFAMTIYLDATGRLLLFASPDSTIDPETLRRQNQTLLNEATLSLQSSRMKMHAYTVTRNAVVRNEGLKNRDDEYWRAVVAMDGPGGEGGVWEDEGVQEAIARAHAAVDVARVRREADGFVENVTKGL